jgi:transcriptional regulator with XRE-family HTH domain
MTSSDTLRRAILAERARGVRQYEIARKADLHPTVLSAIASGAIPIRATDPRIARLADVLGVSVDDCFDGGADA